MQYLSCWTLRSARQACVVVLIIAMAHARAAVAREHTYAPVFQFATSSGYCCGTHQALVAAGAKRFVVGVATDLGAYASLHDASTGELLRHFDVAIDPEDKQEFGSAVAWSKRGLLVGAPAIFGADGGGAFDFPRRDADPTSALLPPDAAGHQWFGNAVAWVGKHILVADSQRMFGSINGPGAAYLFDAENGAILAPLESPDPHQGAAFGAVVASFQGGFAIGEPGTATVAGAVHFYDRRGRYVSTLHAPFPAAGDGFGAALAASGLHLLIGAPGAQVGGAAYLAFRDRGVWRLDRRFDGEPYGAIIGSSVAIAGRRVALGSPSNYTGVYLFDLRDNALAGHIAPPPFDPDTGLPFYESFGSDIAIVGRTIVIANETGDEDFSAHVFGYRRSRRLAAGN